MTDFNEIADMAMEAIVEPKAPPIGTWRGRITSGNYKEVNGDHANSPIARGSWAIKLLEAVEVNETMLDEFGDVDDAGPAYFDIPVFDRRGNWNIKKFLAGLGVEWNGEDTIRTACPKAKGFMVTFDIKHRHNKKDPENPHIDVTDIQVG